MFDTKTKERLEQRGASNIDILDSEGELYFVCQYKDQDLASDTLEGLFFNMDEIDVDEQYEYEMKLMGKEEQYQDSLGNF